MKKFELTYNPFTHERTFLADGKPATLSKCWGEDESRELSEWCGSFFQTLYDKFNDCEMEVRFKGIIRDLEFLEDARDQYRKENPSVSIKLLDEGCVNTTAKLDELKDLFAKMQDESPFPELKTPELKALFEKTVSSEFEMAVVATMSSGKSTLINSMLGCELLPARNEATTATLARIHDMDGMSGFKGTAYDADGAALASCDPLGLGDMDKLNDNRQTSVIEIFGDVVGVESKDIKLVLTDTPGPNNSRTAEHKEHTYALMQADYKPMILYVLNGTQLETTDDDALLKDVAKAMKSGGRQARERFIFVLNKADEFDPAKGESIQKKIDDVKTYLATHGGIKGVRVFPSAARMAKVIRQYLNHQPLTEKEEDEILPKHVSFVKREWKHFSDFSPLSPKVRKLLESEIEEAHRNGDMYREALFYTGVPAIELAISEYLEKYALPAKISEGVISFKGKIDSLGVEASAIDELRHGEDAIAKLKEELAQLTSLIDKGEKARELRDKIDGFSSEKCIGDKLEKARADCFDAITTFLEGKSNMLVSVRSAEKWKNSLVNLLNGVQSKCRVDVQNALNKTIKEQAEDAVKEYKAYLGSLVGNVSLKSPDAILGTAASISVEESLDDFAKRVVVGHRKEKQAGFWGGFKRVASIITTLGLSDWGYEDVTVYGERVDFSNYLNEKILPKVEEFLDSTRKLAIDLAQEKENEFKEFYKQKLAELDEKMKEKISEKEDNLSSQSKIELMIEENRKNLDWLNSFKARLDNVLSLEV